MRSITRMIILAPVALLLSGVSLPAQLTPQEQARLDRDHQNMMTQLGIEKLRPGPHPDEKEPDHANYDPALANPFPNYPDPLTLRNGKKVTTPEMWWRERRPEIVEDFEREIVGRIPRNAPGVTWTVKSRVKGKIGAHPVTYKEMVGKVDNAIAPAINVNIDMILVTPDDVKKPVPVMILFGFGLMPGAKPPEGANTFLYSLFNPPPGSKPAPATEQLIAAGWGYAYLNPNSVQADHGGGLTEGIIGMVNQGKFRKPDDWGALRAWAWSASRALDYFTTDKDVDEKRVGVEGVSRYGKAALVTMAFDTRFAVVLIGSSGEGGAKPHRRNFGEAVENLTGSGEYHWMAGNFLKYGAAKATFGSMNAGDLPVDAHELLALCAPRATFISYGIPEEGDALWLDQQGSFMAAVAAGPVFRLLGVKDLGITEDYRTVKKPAVNVGLLDGHLAWRQHDGGHTDAPNWQYFIPWASRLLGYTPSR